MYDNYSIEGPEHADFLKLVEEGVADAKCLYNNETNMYEGPKTLEEKGLSYDEFVSLKKSDETTLPSEA